MASMLLSARGNRRPTVPPGWLLRPVPDRYPTPDEAAVLLGAAVGSDLKGKTSLLIYAVAIPLAFLHPWMAGALHVVSALMWLVPDRRIERRVSHPGPEVRVGEA